MVDEDLCGADTPEPISALASRFLARTKAYLDRLENFCPLTALAIGVASFVDVTLVPALVGLLRWEREQAI